MRAQPANKTNKMKALFDRKAGSEKINGPINNGRYDKRIATHKWGSNETNDEFTNSNGFVISNGSYSRSIAFFNELANEAKRDFPELLDSDIECFVITKSTYNKGFAGVRFPLPANTRKAGYSDCVKVDFQIC